MLLGSLNSLTGYEETIMQNQQQHNERAVLLYVKNQDDIIHISDKGWNV
jgi:hypothetical protein